MVYEDEAKFRKSMKIVPISPNPSERFYSKRNFQNVYSKQNFWLIGFETLRSIILLVLMNDIEERSQAFVSVSRKHQIIYPCLWNLNVYKILLAMIFV